MLHADTAPRDAHIGYALIVIDVGAKTMFSDLTIRVGACYIGAIIVLTGVLQLAG